MYLGSSQLEFNASGNKKKKKKTLGRIGIRGNINSEASLGSNAHS